MVKGVGRKPDIVVPQKPRGYFRKDRVVYSVNFTEK